MENLYRADGHRSPSQPCQDIAARIQVAIGAILALDVNVSGSTGPLVEQIVSLLVNILNVSDCPRQFLFLCHSSVITLAS
jgi:hypothetical protein